MSVTEAAHRMALDRTLMNLRIARQFLQHATVSMPTDAQAVTRDILADTRDSLDMAIESVEANVR